MIELKRFIELIENDLFREAHEALEKKWHEYKKENNEVNSKIYKGFINGATSLELYRLGRIEPSQRVWATYIKYESLIPHGIDEHIKLMQTIQNLLHEKRNMQLKRV